MLNVVAIVPRGIKNGIGYRYFLKYCFKVRNSSIVTTLVSTQMRGIN